MAVNWYWKHKVGEIIYKDLQHNQKWKLEMFGGNMMCAFIYRFTKINEETHKREHWHTFFTWFNDLQHAKRCLEDNKPLEGLALGTHKVLSVRLCVTSKIYKHSNQEMLKLGKMLAEHGYKVILY